jgi:3'-phosphoadenosine 5'-phosphosulfate (PAPS) 3'-phosphatase
VPSGGAGNKMMMLLEGKGCVYIQDRGVSRWDTCGAQVFILFIYFFIYLF